MTGSEGTLTLDVMTNGQNLRGLGFIPSTTEDEVAECHSIASVPKDQSGRR